MAGTTIAVGIDDSSGARAALAWAVNHAEVTDGHIVAIHAIDPTLAWIDVGSREAQKMIRLARERGATEVVELVAEVQASLGSKAEIETQVSEGDAAKILIEASTSVDVLVVGSRGRGGFASLLLGSVSQRAAEHARCPVVVVPNTETAES